ncbi:MAG: arsenate reductase ArsC [Pseudomonadota bacterium]
MAQILVLCTGNSVRSILAEAAFRRDGAGRLRVWSAGTNPTGRVNPAVLAFLARKGMPAQGLRSKSLAEFAAPAAPRIDLVLTLCTAAATEAGPDLPGSPVAVLWDMADPSLVAPDQLDLSIQQAFHQLSARVNGFLALPVERMSPPAMAEALERLA